jgi:hypothetical protein
MNISVGILGVILTIFASCDAQGQTSSATCEESAAIAQMERKAGKLIEAREELLQCARDVCPEPLRGECSDGVEYVTRSLPTVVFVADDGPIQARAGVKISIDGVVTSGGLDGVPVAVNPGAHVFLFESSTGSRSQRTVIVHEGEKAKRLMVLDILPQGSGPELRPTISSTTRGEQGVPVGTWISGGLGALGLGVAGYLWLTGIYDVHVLSTTCAPECTQSDVDGVRRKFVAADVVLGVGVASLALAGVLWITRPKGAPPLRANGIW